MLPECMEIKRGLAAWLPGSPAPELALSGSWALLPGGCLDDGFPTDSILDGKESGHKLGRVAGLFSFGCSRGDEL